MKMRSLIGWLVLLGSVQPCSAIKVTAFSDLDSYWDRGKDIIVARCSALPDKPEKRLPDGVHLVEVEVIRTLKGTSALGKRSIATTYEVLPGGTYLLYSLGGSIGETNFLAVSELSVVEIPPRVSLSALDEKPPKEQIAAIFSARLQQLQQITKQLAAEKILLEKATARKSP